MWAAPPIRPPSPTRGWTIYISDASSARGSGKTWLGYVTTDSTGAFGGTITGVSGLVAGSGQITGTAIDGSNNTSEFGANYTVVNGLAGTVYVDTNYGGGAGRSKGASSGGTVRPSARVELYTVSGSTATYSSATTTDAYGNYSFTGIAAANYAVRVVASSVDCWPYRLCRRPAAGADLAQQCQQRFGRSRDRQRGRHQPGGQ